jgi:hypothetical protein
VSVTVSNTTAVAYRLAFSTFFGGSGYERAQGLAVDQSGYIYIVGNTLSPDLPTTAGAFQRTYKGDNCSGSSGDGYVAKLTPDGSSLVWATYLGGAGGDRIYNAVVDGAGNVYLAVWTGSADFPTTPGAFQTTLRTAACVGTHLAYSKLRPDGSGLVWSTFVSGSGTEQARGSLHVDSSGNVYSSGWTDSPDFPTTPGAYQTSLRGGKDAFAIKLSSDGSRLVFSTLFGGSLDDQAFTDIAVGTDGRVYIAGCTTSRDLPVSANAYQKTYAGDAGAPWGNGDAFVARFSADGSSLLASTYLGGSGNDDVSINNSVVMDAAGKVTFIGDTDSTDFPVSANAFQKTRKGGIDGYVATLSPDLSNLLHATYIGGSADEETSGVALDSSGNVYFSGGTLSPDYPVSSDAFQKTYKGSSGAADAWFTKLSSDLSTLVYSTYFGGSGTGVGYGDRGRALVLDSSGNVFFSGDTNSADFPVTSGAYQTTYKAGADAFVAKFVPGTSP